MKNFTYGVFGIIIIGMGLWAGVSTTQKAVIKGKLNRAEENIRQKEQYIEDIKNIPPQVEIVRDTVYLEGETKYITQVITDQSLVDSLNEVIRTQGISFSGGDFFSWKEAIGIHESKYFNLPWKAFYLGEFGGVKFGPAEVFIEREVQKIHIPPEPVIKRWSWYVGADLNYVWIDGNYFVPSLNGGFYTPKGWGGRVNMGYKIAGIGISKKLR